MRRFGEPFDARQHYRLRPGAYAILHVGNNVLLTFQDQPKPEFQLPGGGIDPGEQIIPALHREIFEETGWHASGLKRLGVYQRFVYMPEYDLWAQKHCSIYAGRPTTRLGNPIEPDHTDFWCTISDAVMLLANEGDVHFLKRYFGM
ncbi:NUDIX domain-containing protein [Algirhabdus cladophorae]|uniref:NUDIX domain-containing protein n=1 Tax=Algirhabdus cladophorae TaxID=3377108 RepID=UPI003B847EDC